MVAPEPELEPEPEPESEEEEEELEEEVLVVKKTKPKSKPKPKKVKKVVYINESEGAVIPTTLFRLSATFQANSPFATPVFCSSFILCGRVRKWY